MKILAIETSCDETSVAIIETSGSRANVARAVRNRRQPQFRVLAHFVSSQIKLHAQFGGVVPNLAKREHQRLLVPLLVKALKESGLQKAKGKRQKAKLQFKSQNEIKEILNREPVLLSLFEKKILSLPVPDIDVIAVTNGPGLAPALWVGINFAKALALVWRKPIIPMNHMKGHLYAAFVSDAVRGKKSMQFLRMRFPALALLVSGGHTELVLMKKFGSYEIIGETLDDAAGEAFDKVARMLGLGYPGGPAIALEAVKFKSLKIKSLKIKFPRPMISSSDFNFSFSGLKTSVLYFIRDLGDKKSVRALRPAIVKEFQDAVVDVLVVKTIRAARQYKAKTIIVGGGVSANKLLRERLAGEVKEKCKGAELFLPHPSVTGDNALMIALAAAIDGNKKAPNQIRAEANLQLS